MNAASRASFGSGTAKARKISCLTASRSSFPPSTIRRTRFPGMVSIELDTRGRLRRLEAVPPDLTDSADDTNEPDWGALFAAASLDPENFSPVEPRWFPPRYADRRAAWDGIYPDAPEIPIRVEAASFHGRAVAFRIVEPWSAPPPRGGRGEAPWVRPSTWCPIGGLAWLTWAYICSSCSPSPYWHDAIEVGAGVIEG